MQKDEGLARILRLARQIIVLAETLHFQGSARKARPETTLVIATLITEDQGQQQQNRH